MEMSEKSMVKRWPLEDEIDVYGLTHTGKVREVNQDQFLICTLSRQLDVYFSSLPEDGELPAGAERLAFLAIVADGVGGGAKGEEASRIAIEAVTQSVVRSLRCYHTADTADDQAFSDALMEVAIQVHEEVVNRSFEDLALRGMATTLTLWIGLGSRSYLLQVGDSRCYVYRDGDLTQLSRDQTIAQELIDSGVVSRTELSGHWDNVLSSSIGGSQTAPVVNRVSFRWNNVGLLCSDGLTKHVTDDQIRERLATMTSAKQVCEDLLQDALDGGGTDNITLIVGRYVREDSPESVG
jgi:serine/threonine protein phosphatase PrpC